MRSYKVGIEVEYCVPKADTPYCRADIEAGKLLMAASGALDQSHTWPRGRTQAPRKLSQTGAPGV